MRHFKHERVLTVERKIHPTYPELKSLIGKFQYIYTVGKDKISLVKIRISFRPTERWKWELLGGKFEYPTVFKYKREAEEEIKKRYGI